jgi:hypothetical protein
MRNLGGAVGLAMINTVATSRMAVHTLHLNEQVTWSRFAAARALDNMSHMVFAAKSGDAHVAALKQMAMIVQRQALALTYNDVLLANGRMLLPGIPADTVAAEANRHKRASALIRVSPYPCWWRLMSRLSSATMAVHFCISFADRLVGTLLFWVASNGSEDRHGRRVGLCSTGTRPRSLLGTRRT